MGHADYTPEHDDWHIYDADDSSQKANLNTKPTIARTETMVIHGCILETGGDTSKNNATMIMEYSDNEVDWYSVAGQGATSAKFRWHANATLTEHALTSNKLACQTEQGDVHEVNCVNWDHLAGAHLESSFCIEGYNPSYDTTYYFRVTVNATVIPKGSGKTYPQVLIETAPAGAIDELMGVGWNSVDTFMGIEDTNIDEVMGVSSGE